MSFNFLWRKLFSHPYCLHNSQPHFQVTFVMFTTYVMTDPTHILTADKIFTSLTLLNILRMPMAMLPFLIVASVQVLSQRCACTEHFMQSFYFTSSVTGLFVADVGVLFLRPLFLVGDCGGIVLTWRSMCFMWFWYLNEVLSHIYLYMYGYLI